MESELRNYGTSFRQHFGTGAVAPDFRVLQSLTGGESALSQTAQESTPVNENENSEKMTLFGVSRRTAGG